MIGTSPSAAPPLYVGLTVDDWKLIKELEADTDSDTAWLCVCHCGTTQKRSARSIYARRLPACSGCMTNTPQMPDDVGKWPMRDLELRRSLRAAGF